MSKLFNTDICILGGGLVGATLAKAIALNTGYQCLVVEAQSKADLIQPQAERSDQRSLVLTYKTIECLRQWQIISPDTSPDIALSLIKQVDAGRWQADKPDVTDLCLHHQDVDLPYLAAVLPAAQLITTLHEQLDQCTSCSCLYQHYAETIVYDEQGLPIVTLNTRDKIKAELLIIAEGRQAKSAKQLNITYKEHIYPQKVCVFNLEIQHSLLKDKNRYKALWYNIPGGSLALVPRYKTSDAHADIQPDKPGYGQHKQILSYGCVLTLKNKLADQWLTQSEQQQFSDLSRYLPETMTLIGKTKAVVYPLAVSTALELARPNIVLMGNSAASLPPLGAQSLNLSFRLVELLLRHLKHQPGDLPLSWTGLYDLSVRMQREIELVSQAISYSLDCMNYLDPYLDHGFVSGFTSLGLRLLNKTTPVKKMFIRKALGL